MFPVSLLKSASIAPSLPTCVEFFAAGQHQFDFQILLLLIPSAMYSR